jgi:hypothetical protein
MKKKILLMLSAAVILITAGIIFAADHADSPTITGKTTDITDVYVFRGENPDNLVFVANTQGLLSPAASSSAQFDDNTLIEFNIDNNGDAVEDLVIQAISKNGNMRIYGPYKPAYTGVSSMIIPNQFRAQVEITPYGQPDIISEQRGIKVFAGPKDDPFFFDLNQFRMVLSGQASGFNNPGNDTFAGTNVLSVVVEVPKSMLGTGNSINVWLETKTKES